METPREHRGAYPTEEFLFRSRPLGVRARGRVPRNRISLLQPRSDPVVPLRLPSQPTPCRGIRRPTARFLIFAARQIYGSFFRAPVPTTSLKSVRLSCAVRKYV